MGVPPAGWPGSGCCAAHRAACRRLAPSGFHP